jgi:predicted DNA-binding transcriptional regulator AlpA
MTTLPGDRILTERELAEIMSFSPRTLQAWRQRQAGPPFIRVGRSIRYSLLDVIAWMKAQTCAPNAEGRRQ